VEHAPAPSLPPVLAAVGVGSNLGDRAGHIAAALAALSTLTMTELVRVGPVVETRPVLPAGADAAALTGAGGAYLNTAALLRTGLGPRELLDELHDIERSRGRERSADSARRWEARTLDLDLLVYGDAFISEPGLVVPHPRMRERRFVLEPLAAIAPDLIVPGGGPGRWTVAMLLSRLDGAPGPELPSV
jgi:2-amino-4-hydroxy-6-hydroxymethyldihydropteridine diphosphokinase